MSDQQKRPDVILPTEEDLQTFEKLGRTTQRKRGLGEIALGLAILFVVFLPAIRSLMYGSPDQMVVNTSLGGILLTIVGFGLVGVGILRLLKP